MKIKEVSKPTRCEVCKKMAYAPYRFNGHAFCDAGCYRIWLAGREFADFHKQNES